MRIKMQLLNFNGNSVKEDKQIVRGALMLYNKKCLLIIMYIVYMIIILYFRYIFKAEVNKHQSKGSTRGLDLLATNLTISIRQINTICNIDPKFVIPTRMTNF